MREEVTLSRLILQSLKCTYMTLSQMKMYNAIYLTIDALFLFYNSLHSSTMMALLAENKIIM